jgi:UDP-4-amino-4,6-dideoxy-N-acetyl-beta-L-altrosamine transaminase
VEFKVIPYGRQNITAEDLQAVAEVLNSDFLTQGPIIKKFEDLFANYIGCKYAVAVSNGTAALHLCTLALGVESGHRVITTPITFAASANCVRYCGGEVLFADIDPETYLIDLKQVEKILSSDISKAIKGLILVDFAGRAVNLEEFKVLAKKYDLWIIEDSCHAPGGYFVDKNGNNQNCGNGQFADLAIFSFHPVKHIATGEGGMVTTNDEDLYHKLLDLRTHGITRDSNKFSNDLAFATGLEDYQGDYPLWYMEMQNLGYNYRLTDFQAALGISQLNRAEKGLERRREIALAYESAFKNNRKILGQSASIEGHAYHLYVIEVTDRLGLYNYLRSFNIYAQIHYIPTHLMPYYRQFGHKEGDLPHAERYYKQCLSLPMYPTLTVDEQKFVIEAIEKYLD